MGIYYNQLEVNYMKKNISKLFIIIFISGFFIGNFINKRSNYREFEFRGGLAHSNGGYVSSISYVLVNEKHFDLEELYEKIYDQYILMNGEPDELTFYLYNSKENLDKFDPFSSRYYKK